VLSPRRPAPWLDLGLEKLNSIGADEAAEKYRKLTTLLEDE
jgi:hypothetical protein